MKTNDDIFKKLRSIDLNTAEAESLLGIIDMKLEKIEDNTVYLAEIASNLSGLYELLAEKLEPEEPKTPADSNLETINVVGTEKDDDLLS